MKIIIFLVLLITVNSYKLISARYSKNKLILKGRHLNKLRNITCSDLVFEFQNSSTIIFQKNYSRQTENPYKLTPNKDKKLKYLYKNKKKEISLYLLFKKNRKLRIHQSNIDFPQIFDIFPKNLPDTGAISFVKGANFYGVKELKKEIFCVVNNDKRLAKIINDKKLECFITEITITDKDKNEFELSFLLGDTPIQTKNRLMIKFYGIFNIFPSNGPMNLAVNVSVFGFGFYNHLNPFCHMFSVNQKVEKAKIINETHIECYIKPITELISRTDNYFSTFDISLFPKNSTQRKLRRYLKNYDFWAESGTLFYYFWPPQIIKVDPPIGPIDQVNIIYLESPDEWSFKNALVSYSDLPHNLVAAYYLHRISCRFEDFGITEGLLINAKTIKCNTPLFDSRISNYFRVQKKIELSFNNQTFFGSDGIKYTFIGTKSPLLYTWIILYSILASLIIAGGVYMALLYLREKKNKD